MYSLTHVPGHTPGDGLNAVFGGGVGAQPHKPLVAGHTCHVHDGAWQPS